MVLTLFLFSFAGYKAGFIFQIFYTTLAAVSLTAAYFLSPAAVVFFSEHIKSDSQQFTAFLFVAMALFIFMLLHFISRSIRKKMKCSGRINHILGAVCGLIVAAIVIVETYRNTILLESSNEINVAVEQSGANQVLATAEKWVDKKVDDVNGFSSHTKSISIPAGDDPVCHSPSLLSYCNYSFHERPDLEKEMLVMINAEREKNGLPALINDEPLKTVARAHSADMFIRGYFSHDTPDGINPFQRIRNAGIHYLFAGENLAMSSSLQKAHINLMNSAGHRANILRKSYGRVGIGILDGGTHGLMISQEFRD